MENDIVLYSTNAIRSMEVIDVATGSKIGYVKDYKIDLTQNRIIAITLPGTVKSWFGKDNDIEIPWEKVVKIGVDVLLVDASEVEQFVQENNN